MLHRTRHVGLWIRRTRLPAHSEKRDEKTHATCRAHFVGATLCGRPLRLQPRQVIRHRDIGVQGEKKGTHAGVPLQSTWIVCQPAVGYSDRGTSSRAGCGRSGVHALDVQGKGTRHSRGGGVARHRQATRRTLAAEEAELRVVGRCPLAGVVCVGHHRQRHHRWGFTAEADAVVSYDIDHDIRPLWQRAAAE
jgi:hypothetical protein